MEFSKEELREIVSCISQAMISESVLLDKIPEAKERYLFLEDLQHKLNKMLIKAL